MGAEFVTWLADTPVPRPGRAPATLTVRNAAAQTEHWVSSPYDRTPSSGGRNGEISPIGMGRRPSLNSLESERGSDTGRDEKLRASLSANDRRMSVKPLLAAVEQEEGHDGESAEGTALDRHIIRQRKLSAIVVADVKGASKPPLTRDKHPGPRALAKMEEEESVEIKQACHDNLSHTVHDTIL